MTLRWKTALATLALTLMPVAAFADTDATSTPDDATAVAGDATATTDTGGGSFSENPCWDQKCAAETAACKASANCVKLAGCIKAKDDACAQDINTKDPAAVKLFQDIAACGYKSCNDPTKGTCKGNCGKFMGDSAPCNCDDACKDYGDCCADYDAECSGGGGGGTAPAGSCKGSDCAENSKGIGADGKPAACYCDEGCDQYGDCCTDKAQYCKSTGGDTGSTADVSSCTAKCAGKKCGDDDGCGGKCSGTCDNGGVCSASKTCTGGSTSDVSSTKDAGSLDTATGGTGTTGTTNTGSNTSNASSCNASGTSNGSWGLALALFGLIGAIVLRRRAV